MHCSMNKLCSYCNRIIYFLLFADLIETFCCYFVIVSYMSHCDVKSLSF